MGVQLRLLPAITSCVLQCVLVVLVHSFEIDRVEFNLSPTFSDAEQPLLRGQFSEDFAWGVATSAYQIEGGWNSGGRGKSIWDTMTDEKIHVKDASDGKIACDSYNKADEDVRLLKELNVTHYRFSISWCRVMPNGTGEVNHEGLHYYKELVTRLVEEGITPMATIYHWDLPQALEDQGGWLNPEISKWFEDYARVCFEHLGEQVKLWCTINEAAVTALLGYGFGIFAPRKTGLSPSTYLAAHNQLRAHAAAYRLYDREFRKSQGGKVGQAIPSNWYQSADNDPKNREAASKLLIFSLAWFADPMYHGDYPKVMKDQLRENARVQGLAKSVLPEFTEEEKKQLKGSCDFFGLNYYTSREVTFDNRTDPTVQYLFGNNLLIAQWIDSRWLRLDANWIAVYPPGIRRLLRWIKSRYNNPPIYITENGVNDRQSNLNDMYRIYYLKHHLNQCLKAYLIDKVRLEGYFVWSLLDNFEWASGYVEKFGIVRVDFSSPNRTRTKKASFHYYKSLIEKNGF